jgi:hypothetical protein
MSNVPDFEQDLSTEPIRAERANIIFADGLTLDGYKMPDGEFRVGIEGASKILGFTENWLYKTLARTGNKTLQTLSGWGFDASLTTALVNRPQGGTSTVTTISLDDFNVCIIYGVQSRKKPAIALSQAFSKLALIDFFRDAFGDRPLTIEEKRQLFYQTYAASLSREDWLEMDREDVRLLTWTGDN